MAGTRHCTKEPTSPGKSGRAIRPPARDTARKPRAQEWRAEGQTTDFQGAWESAWTVGKKKTFAPRAALEGRWAEEKIMVSRLRSYGTINGNEVFVARNPGAGQWVP